MKAFIFYDQIASALKVSNLLQTVRPDEDIIIGWEISLWHTGILRFPSVADEALIQGSDTEMIVFAGCPANLLRPWTIQWLERWVSTRLNGHAVLAMVDDDFSDIRPRMDAFELSEFASRHNVAFVACGNDIDEMNRLGIRERALPWRGFRTNAEYCESTFA
jgi:hypothetical protein